MPASLAPNHRGINGGNMFLNALAADDRPKFLDLLYFVAKADGNVTEDELLQIGAYANEMGVSNIANDSNSLESTVNHFAQRSELVRKVVFAEIIALAHVDNYFHPEEKSLVDNLKAELKISDHFRNEIIAWVEEIRPIYARGFSLLGLV
jgi:uncharacterized membrane protein YebE (DUF533 family)